MIVLYLCVCFFCFKQKTAYEVRISDWSSNVCSSDLLAAATNGTAPAPNPEAGATTATGTQSTAKAGAANTQPDKAITSEELGRIKPLYRGPPSARIEIIRGDDRSTVTTK